MGRKEDFIYLFIYLFVCLFFARFIDYCLSCLFQREAEQLSEDYCDPGKDDGSLADASTNTLIPGDVSLFSSFCNIKTKPEKCSGRSTSPQRGIVVHLFQNKKKDEIFRKCEVLFSYL